jgi:hypothetical protein
VAEPVPPARGGDGESEGEPEALVHPLTLNVVLPEASGDAEGVPVPLPRRASDEEGEPVPQTVGDSGALPHGVGVAKGEPVPAPRSDGDWEGLPEPLGQARGEALPRGEALAEAVPLPAASEALPVCEGEPDGEGSREGEARGVAVAGNVGEAREEVLAPAMVLDGAPLGEPPGAPAVGVPEAHCEPLALLLPEALLALLPLLLALPHADKRRLPVVLKEGVALASPVRDALGDGDEKSVMLLRGDGVATPEAVADAFVGCAVKLPTPLTVAAPVAEGEEDAVPP